MSGPPPPLSPAVQAVVLLFATTSAVVAGLLMMHDYPLMGCLVILSELCCVALIYMGRDDNHSIVVYCALNGFLAGCYAGAAAASSQLQ